MDFSLMGVLGVRLGRGASASSGRGGAAAGASAPAATGTVEGEADMAVCWGGRGGGRKGCECGSFVYIQFPRARTWCKRVASQSFDFHSHRSQGDKTPITNANWKASLNSVAPGHYLARALSP